MNCKQQLVKGI